MFTHGPKSGKRQKTFRKYAIFKFSKFQRQSIWEFQNLEIFNILKFEICLPGNINYNGNAYDTDDYALKQV